jgi:hypothetical protein
MELGSEIHITGQLKDARMLLIINSEGDV